LYFQVFLKNNKCKDLLFNLLAGQYDSTSNFEQVYKEAVQYNYKILADCFAVSHDKSVRETAIQHKVLPRILERLSAISGEKPRVYEDP